LIATGFTGAVHVTTPRGQPNVLYVAQQDGRISAIDLMAVKHRVVLDLRRRVGRTGFQGLLSLAFHPQYASNRRLYVFFVGAKNDVVVEEYRARGDSVDAGTRRAILRVPQPRQGRYGHFGGQLAFGPDGSLYAAIGDGLGNGSQNPDDLYGKLFRLDVDRPDNEPVVMAYGLRNPWRFSFDRLTGSLYVTDVGDARWEEINIVRPRTKGLLNFGWDRYEAHRSRRDDDVPLPGRLVFPVAVYGHGAGNCSIVGGFVYRGQGVPKARGRYFFGDLCSGRIWTLRAGAGQRTMRPTGLRVRGLTSFGEDARGELYLVLRHGRLYRLTQR
jgi:glucose/arabinose dehydrogenase